MMASTSSLRYGEEPDPTIKEPPLTEGQIHASAAEVIDAPLLVLRIAQHKVEMSKLIESLRGAGACSRGHHTRTPRLPTARRLTNLLPHFSLRARAPPQAWAPRARSHRTC